jgi:hypothetical protein
MEEEKQKGIIFQTSQSGGTQSDASVEISPPGSNITRGLINQKLSYSDVYNLHQSGREYERLILRIENLEKESVGNKDLLLEIQKDLWFFRLLRKLWNLFWKNTGGRIIKT